MSLAPVLCALLLGADTSVTDLAKQIERRCRSGDSAQADEALKLLEKLQRKARKDKDWLLYVRWRRACCEFHLGKLQEARETLQEAVKDTPKAFGLLYYMRRHLGEFCLRCGDLREAKHHLSWACDQLENKKVPSFKGTPLPVEETAQIHTRLLFASCCQSTTEIKKAHTTLLAIEKRLEEKTRDQKGKALTGPWEDLPVYCQAGLADLERRLSDPVGALKRLRWCLGYLRNRTFSQARQLEFNCRIGLALNYQNLARFQDAQTQLERAERVLPRIRTPRNAADLESAFAALLVEPFLPGFTRDQTASVLEQLARSEKRVRRSLALASGQDVFTANRHDLLAKIHRLRGQVLRWRGQTASARAAFERATRFADEGITRGQKVWGPDYDQVLQFRRYRAWLYLQTGRLDDAWDEASDAYQRYARHHDESDVGRGDFQHLLLEIAQRQGRLQAAADLARSHRQLSARRLTPYLAGLTAPEQLRFFRGWDDPALHAGLRLGLRGPDLQEHSAEWLLNGKARIAEVMATVTRHARGGKDPQFQRLVRRQAALLYGRPGDNLPALRQELLQVEEKKRELAATRPIRVSGRWYDLKQLRQRLAPGEVYIDVFSLAPSEELPRAYWAWVLTRAEPPRVVWLGDAATIDRLVGEFVAHMAQCLSQFDADGPADTEKELQQTILAPLSAALLNANLWKLAGKYTHWTVSPDAQLWNVPWGALLLPGSGKYAVEQITFRYAISGRDLLRRATPRGPAGAPWILANPDLNHPPKAGWRKRRSGEGLLLKRLDGAAAEGRAVAKCLRARLKVQPRLETDRATKDALLRLTSPRVVYLATHGFSPLPDRDLPVDDPLLRCGVAFAGLHYVPASRSAATSLPGLLTGAEVLGIDLRGTELVVLSSCRTGRGVTHYGQSPADLRHAFHLAGARAVVSSLWSVPDVETKDLMLHFLEPLAGRDLADKAAALKEAQYQMIRKLRGGRLRHAHPYYWAAFTLSGS